MEEYNYKSRRAFLRDIAGTAAFFTLSGFPTALLANTDEYTKITILHTNDWHSRIEPFPDDGGRYAGMGGAVYRAAIINEIRKQEKNVLLLDDGDVFQGTPYFNFYGGELEFKLMSKMGYDAGTLGNHDFDAGLDGLNKQLLHADFPILNANYDFSNTLLKDKFKPYKVFQKGGIRIGVFGIGIKLEGLVPAKLYGDTVYNDPLEAARKMSEILRKEEHCNLVICLSHLGYRYKDAMVSDEVIAKQTEGIDLIIGGHTHTFMEAPASVKNSAGNEVLIFQVGWAGINLGRVDFFLEKKSKKKWAKHHTVVVTKKTN
jgi:5'-nucleotidase